METFSKNKIVSIGCIITLIISFALYVCNLSTPLFLIYKFSASSLQLGIAGFLNSFFYTLFLIIFYKIKKNKNFPWFVIVCFFIGNIYIFLPFSKNYYFFLFLIALNSIFYSRFWPSIQFLFAAINQTDKYNIFWSFGVFTGVFLSGYFFKLNEKLPFLIGGFSAIICFLMGVIVFKYFLFFYKNAPEKFKIEKKIDKKFKKTLFTNWISFFSLGGMLFIFPKLSKEIGYSSVVISNIFACLFVFRFLSFLIFSRISITLSEQILFFPYLIAGISFIITGFVKTPLLHFISVPILGIGAAFSFKLVFSEIAQKGYSTELNEIIIGTGWLSGSFIVGYLSHILGISEGFILTGFLILVFYILQRNFIILEEK